MNGSVDQVNGVKPGMFTRRMWRAVCGIPPRSNLLSKQSGHVKKEAPAAQTERGILTFGWFVLLRLEVEKPKGNRGTSRGPHMETR